jgi:hypothetical protein
MRIAPSYNASDIMDSDQLSGATFEAALRRLLSSPRDRDNVASIACEDCRGCSECTFCKGCANLTRCQHCVGCEDCSDCTHCASCRSCLMCQHCADSERCVASAYLVRCVGCSGCTYCFGSVGLRRRDFHILNEPYDRATYFILTQRLARELGMVLP